MRLSNKRRAQNTVGIGVAIACPRRGATYINFPVIDQIMPSGDVLWMDIGFAAVLIDEYIVGALGLMATEISAQAEGTKRAN